MSSSPWVLCVPAEFTPVLGRAAILEEVVPHRKRPRDSTVPPSDEVVNVTRFHLRVTEVLRHVADPPADITGDYCSSVAEACASLAGLGVGGADPMLSLVIPPSCDVYGWPVGDQQGGAMAIVRIRAEVLALQGKSWESDEMLRWAQVLEEEMRWAGIHTLKDISEEMVSGKGVVCTPFEQVHRKERLRNTDTGAVASDLRDLVAIETTEALSRIERITNEGYVPAPSPTVEKAMSLLNDAPPTPLDVPHSGRAMLRAIPDTMREAISVAAGLPTDCHPSDVVCSAGDLQRVLHATQFAISSLLTRQPGAGRRWYLKVGTAVSAVPIPTFLVLPSSTFAAANQLCGGAEGSDDGDDINGFQSLDALTGVSKRLDAVTVNQQTKRDDAAMNAAVGDGMTLAEWVYSGRIIDAGCCAQPSAADVLALIRKSKKLSAAALRAQVSGSDVSLAPIAISLPGRDILQGWVATIHKPNVFVVLHGPRVADGAVVDPTLLKELCAERDSLALAALRERQMQRAAALASNGPEAKEGVGSQQDVSNALRSVLSKKGASGASVREISDEVQQRLGGRRLVRSTLVEALKSMAAKVSGSGRGVQAGDFFRLKL